MSSRFPMFAFLSDRIRRFALLLIPLAACGDGPTTASARPKLLFVPATVTFSAQQPGATVTVRALAGSVGPTPTFRWRSLAPSDVVVEEVREGGTVVVLRAVRPRATGVELQVSGATTVTDTLPVTVLAAQAAR